MTFAAAGRQSTGARDPDGTIHALSEREYLSRLEAATIGRIGFVSAEGVEILPVS